MQPTTDGIIPILYFLKIRDDDLVAHIYGTGTSMMQSLFCLLIPLHQAKDFVFENYFVYVYAYTQINVFKLKMVT